MLLLTPALLKRPFTRQSVWHVWATVLMSGFWGLKYPIQHRCHQALTGMDIIASSVKRPNFAFTGSTPRGKSYAN